MEKNQEWWKMVDEVLHQQFACHLEWEDDADGKLVRVRHETTTDEEWEEEKKNPMGVFMVTFFTQTMRLQAYLFPAEGEEDEKEEVEVEFARVWSINADSGESCIVESSPTAVAALLYTGW